MSDQSHQEFGARLDLAMRNNASFSLEWPLRRADGTSFIAKLSIAPVHDTHGGLFGFIGSIADLTQTRHAAARTRLLAEASRIFA